ncbi:radical SAM protein, partial [Acidobacteria bacterium AH-259-D05]|nr:radical SAM protein [Acidobacteria bacterium AH-259-D05]
MSLPELKSITYPSYLMLYQSGELEKRVQEGLEALADCTVCPRDCHVNRLEDKQAVCHTGRYARVASFFPHRGEERCLQGWGGSGTIFFSYCNLRCVFCQNFDVSQEGIGKITPPERLAEIMLELQDLGCHNINFVTPEHVVPQILEALAKAIPGGLRLPLVYNTSGYDSLHSLRLMEGIVDIYMPDFKFWDSPTAFRYVKAKDYVESVKAAVREMHRQVGDLIIGKDGVARRGLLVRHLVMPGGLAGTRQVMKFLREEISPDTYVNLMSQYYPAGKSDRYPEINRRITAEEFQEALREAWKVGIHRFDEL